MKVNKNSILLIIVILFIFSCKKEYHKYNYYDTGEVKNEFVYYNRHDTSSYIYYEFYKNEHYKKRINIIKGKKENHFINYYDNGKIKEIYSFKNNKLHGQFIKYDTNGTVNDEFLFLHGQDVLYKKHWLYSN